MAEYPPQALAQPSQGGEARSVRVTVVYAEADAVWRQALSLPVGATVAQAVADSGFLRAFPQYPPEMLARVGLYGRLCGSEHVLAQDDRIEILRPLRFDAQQSRLRRARHRARTAAQQPK